MTSSPISPPAAKRPRTARIGDRTMLACIGCKQRKLKCDGQSPKCQNCIKSSRDCLVEDPATGLQRPRDYLKSLETRVAYLESLLQQVRPDVALDHLGSTELHSYSTYEANDIDHGPISPNNLPCQPDSISPETTATAAQQASVRRPSSVHSEDQRIDVLSSEVALLCLSATGRDPHYFGPSSAVSFSRIVGATMGLPTTSSVASGSQHSAAAAREPSPFSAIQEETSLRLPSPPMAEKLTNAYWNNIHPQYPVLHRPTFRTWERNLRKDGQPEIGTESPTIPLYFVLMVYAIGSLVLCQSYYEAAEKYYAAALVHLPPILELNTLESVQGILACAVYSIRSPIGASLWKISGMAIRHCVELGYHRSTECYRRNADTLTKEMLKRCFWVAYDIDRVAAFILGRPVGIPEDCIDVELPADIDDEDIAPTGFSRRARTTAKDPPTLMTGALHVIQLRRLWAKISDCLYSKASHFSIDVQARKGTVESLREELEQWRSSLPSQLDFAQSNPLSVFASSEWFRLAYDHSILILYRPFITASEPEDTSSGNIRPDQEIVELAFDECSRCARDMCLHYRRLYQSSSVQFTWGSVHILFLGGLTYLYCLWRSQRVRQKTKQTDVISTCMACSTVLVIVAERWSLGTSYRDLFETLSEKTIGMVCGDGNLSDPSQIWTGVTQPPVDTTLQDWINNGLDTMAIPEESGWFVQELLQGLPQWPGDGFD
ncbi:transcription factor domain-containing protein [Aspergillus stella-maris]|uniref:transcription factor domain-containing protein n=1 Tax=Aspergillus stella-maris TaxID=1810926 RepID=UPI003CCD4CEF